MSDIETPKSGGFNWLLLIPLVITLGLGTMAALSFQISPEDRSSLPSAFEGRPAPALDLPPLNPMAEGPTTADLSKPGIKMVNFWASWCPPCRLEHPKLLEMQAEGMPIIGVNIRDQEANAAKYLGTEAGFKACETAVLTHGGMGYAREYHVERYMREAMLARIAPVSREMILNFISERVLGLPKSY